MTQQEFLFHYKDLSDTFGVNSFGANRGKLIFRHIGDLPQSWWKNIVEHMIITNKPNHAIFEAAHAERKAMNSAKRAKEESEAMDNLLRNASRDDSEKARELFNMFKKKNKGA